MSPRIAVAVLFAVLAAGCRLRQSSPSSDDAGATITLDGSAGQGMLAVQVRQCGQCHQSPDPNDGILSGQDTPVPGTMAYGSNLTPDPDTGMDVQDAGTIASSVLLAQTPDGGPLCPAMPAYASQGMDAGEALAIAAYLQSLTPVWHPVPSSRCVAPAAGDGG